MKAYCAGISTNISAIKAKDEGDVAVTSSSICTACYYPTHGDVVFSGIASVVQGSNRAAPHHPVNLPIACWHVSRTTMNMCSANKSSQPCNKWPGSVACRPEHSDQEWTFMGIFS